MDPATIPLQKVQSPTELAESSPQPTPPVSTSSPLVQQQQQPRRPPGRPRKSTTPSETPDTNPGQTANGAAATVVPAGGKRKKNLEVMGRCIHCGKTLASFFMRGSKAVVEAGVIIEVSCIECEGGVNPADEDDGDVGSGGGGTGKKKRTRLEKIDCEVCKKPIGVGRVRGTDENADADFTIEVVCSSCKGRFGFCTECGGGGKYRTGKYRPVELFPKGRKTCLLSHVRVGKSGLEYWCFRSGEVRGEVLPRYGKVFMDAFLSLYATPKVMEEVPAFHTFHNVRKFLREAWHETVEDLLRPDTADSVFYCAVSWINGPVKVKGKPRSLDEAGGGEGDGASILGGVNSGGRGGGGVEGSDSDGPLSPNILDQLLGGVGGGAGVGSPGAGSGGESVGSQVLASPTPSTSTMPSMSTATGGTSTAPAEEDRCYVGIGTAEYSPSTRTLYISQLAVMQSVQSQGIAKRVIESIVDRVRREWDGSGFGGVEYVWLLTRRINFAMQRFSEKYGFRLKEVWEGERRGGGEGRSGSGSGVVGVGREGGGAGGGGGEGVSPFERDGYDMDEYLTYVASVQELRKGIDAGRVG
ncbi:hypothetical protein HDV00_008606 [Rhizophlyctis rosea]|nr:hypothetical protein HDV00_008606 [Rhizophlyctis rosea]